MNNAKNTATSLPLHITNILTMDTKRDIYSRITSPKFLLRIADLMMNEDLCRDEAFEKELSVGEEQSTGRISDNDPLYEYTFHDQFVTRSWISNYIDLADGDTNHSALIISTRTAHSIHATFDNQDKPCFVKPDIKQTTHTPTNVRNRPQRLPPNFR